MKRDEGGQDEKRVVKIDEENKCHRKEWHKEKSIGGERRRTELMSDKIGLTMVTRERVLVGLREKVVSDQQNEWDGGWDREREKE